MSYSIYYDKCFIKVVNKEMNSEVYMPFILSGDNNVYECGIGGKQRRARDWHNQTYHVKNGGFFATKDEIIESIMAERNDLIERHKGADAINDIPYTDEQFGWFTALAIGGKTCGNTTFSTYKNFYLKGIKDALTIEEYIQQLNIRFKIHCYVWDEVKFKAETGLEVKPDVVFESTEHMLSLIDEYKSYYKGNTQMSIYITNYGSYSINNRKPKGVRTVSTKKTELTNNYWTIAYEENYYFAKFTKYGFRYGYRPFKKFATEKEAIRFHSKMKDRMLPKEFNNFSVKFIQ